MTASEQLERLLYILPAAAREGGTTIDELARALAVDRAAVLSDLQLATARAYYQPAGHVDCFEIYIEGDIVRVHAPDDFRRPVRLSRPEALALGLGLRALAAEAEVERRAEILALAVRLEDELATPELQLQPRLAPEMGVLAEMAVLPTGLEQPLDVALGEDELRGDLSEAIAARRVCRVTYLKPHDREPAEREIMPLLLLYTSGHWYVRALTGSDDQPHNFRLDRILAIEQTGRTFEPSAEQAAGAMMAFTPPGAARAVEVRYSPAIARWVAERHADAVREEDGSVRLTHQVADESWLIRHVLQYGGEAVVVEGPLRPTVTQAAERLLA